MTEKLASGVYMGWSCGVDTSKPGQLQQQLDLAVAHFKKRHGRLPRAIALPEEGDHGTAVSPSSEQSNPAGEKDSLSRKADLPGSEGKKKAAELTAPAGTQLIRMKSVRPGDIHLYL